MLASAKTLSTPATQLFSTETQIAQPPGNSGEKSRRLAQTSVAFYHALRSLFAVCGQSLCSKHGLYDTAIADCGRCAALTRMTHLPANGSSNAVRTNERSQNPCHGSPSVRER